MKPQRLLQLALASIFVIEGADKFINVLANWQQYIPPFFREIGIPIDIFIMGLGIGEIALALLIAIKPRIGGYLACLLFGGICVNLLLLGNYFNIIILDAGLAVCSVAMAKLFEANESS